MRVSKIQIVHGVTSFIQEEILPKMGDDRAVQIILSIAAHAAIANNRLVDTVLGNEIIKALLEDDGSGTYEVGGIADAMRAAVSQYGSFPVTIPAIPLISPHEMTLNLNADDVDALRRRIENAV